MDASACSTILEIEFVQGKRRRYCRTCAITPHLGRFAAIYLLPISDRRQIRPCAKGGGPRIAAAAAGTHNKKQVLARGPAAGKRSEKWKVNR
jgi:hypothetical protein